jgi:hypothetical protein
MLFAGLRVVCNRCVKHSTGKSLDGHKASPAKIVFRLDFVSNAKLLTQYQDAATVSSSNLSGSAGQSTSGFKSAG